MNNHIVPKEYESGGTIFELKTFEKKDDGYKLSYSYRSVYEYS